MPNDDLPLPDPKGVLHDAFGNDPLTFVPWPPPQSLYVSCSTLAIYTADQMRARSLWLPARGIGVLRVRPMQAH